MTVSFITTVDLKIVGIFRNWNVFSQGSVNTFACKSLQIRLTRGAGNTANWNCPMCGVYSQLYDAVCSGYIALWLLHSHFSCIWSWSSFHMELIWNPPLPTRCIWVLEICLWELLGFMLFHCSISKSCWHVRTSTISSYSKCLSSLATVASTSSIFILTGLLWNKGNSISLIQREGSEVLRSCDLKSNVEHSLSPISLEPYLNC